jgi:hypothetical protein
MAVYEIPAKRSREKGGCLFPAENAESSEKKIKDQSFFYPLSLLPTPCPPLKFDELVKGRQEDGFVKNSPAAGGTRRAKTEKGGAFIPRFAGQRRS